MNENTSKNIDMLTFCHLLHSGIFLSVSSECILDKINFIIYFLLIKNSLVSFVLLESQPCPRGLLFFLDHKQIVSLLLK